jgi:hypothetical protein
MTAEIIHLPPPSHEEDKELRPQLTIVHTYTLLIIADCQTRGSLQIGTAVLIRIANRLFAATAKHCIGNAPLLVFGEEFSLPSPPTPFLRCLSHPNLDIGLLEVKADTTPYGCSVESLDASIPVLPEDPRSPKPPFHWIVGYPWAEAEQTGDLLRITAVSVGTHPVKVEATRYQFTYPLQFFRLVGDSPESGDKPETPHGFSGGGIWRFVPSEANRLFVPGDNIRLCGIQSEWWKPERHAYVVPISCWIKFVYDHYADLQHLLAERFPFLRDGE